MCTPAFCFLDFFFLFNKRRSHYRIKIQELLAVVRLGEGKNKKCNMRYFLRPGMAKINLTRPVNLKHCYYFFEVAIWTVTVHLDFLRYMDCYSPYSRSTVDQLYGR